MVVLGEFEDFLVVDVLGEVVGVGDGEPVSLAEVGWWLGEEEAGGESSASEVFAGSEFVEGLGLDGGADNQIG